MADKRITDLNLIQFSAITSNDVLPIVDINTDETNKITIDQIKTYVNSGITDTYITGGTYVTGGTIIFDYSTGGGFQLTGLTEDLNNEIAGLAEADEQTITLNLDTNKIELKETVASATGGTRTFQGNFAISGGTLNLNTIGSGSPVINLGLDSSGFVVTGTTSIPFTGNTSGDCISDLYVSNVHSCSPLHINPNDEGNVYFGSTSGVTVDLTNHKLVVENLQITSGATDGYILTSDASGNIGLTAPTDGFTYQIGQYVEEEGGVIFHRYKDGTNENYLVVTIDDQSTGTTWSNITDQLAGADSTWNGLENSLTITGQTGHTESAAQLCLEYGEGCDNILVTYTLEGGEPVTVEVDSIDNKYIIEGVGTIEKVGTEWLVQSDELCTDCVNVTFTYLGIDYEFDVPKIATTNGKNQYSLGGITIDGLDDSDINISWGGGFGLVWSFVINGGDVYINSGDTECPISNNWVYETGLELENLITTICKTTQATLSEDTPCPFGEYTIEDESIFSAFSVAPVNPINDWYLPAIDELSLLWQNRFNVNRTLSGNSSYGSIPGATQIGYDRYWSSTEYDDSNAWGFYFSLGNAYYNFGKSSTLYVRSVRKFSI